MLRRFTILIITMLFTFCAWSQNGTIQGVVMDKELNEAVFGAEVFIDGTLYGAMTDLDGSYTIENINPGTYTFTCSNLLYGNTSKENIVVSANETTMVNFELGEQVDELEGITVVIHKDKETENAAVDEMKTETKVVEIVSSQEMSKKGDSKASDAVKRVSGVSVVGGKYVFVRGLSDRYTKTILNGSEIPGLDPNRNSVQLDLFPSSFISSIKIIKTFSPDLPGDFSGGLVDLRTKEYPDSFFVQVKGSLGYNPQVNFNSDYLLTERSKTDWLGFDDGTRDFPQEANQAIEAGTWPKYGEELAPDPEGQQAADDFDRYTKSFNDVMTPSEQSNFLNHSLGITLGNKYKIKLKKDSLRHRTFGFFAGLNYKRTYSFIDDGKIGRYKLLGNVDDVNELHNERDLDFKEGKDEVLIGFTLNNIYRFNTNNKIRLDFVRNQSGTTTGRISEGFNDNVGDPDVTFRQQTMRYTQRALSAVQLSGEHQIDDVFGKNPLQIDWLNSASLAEQKEPDLRYWTDLYSADSAGNENYYFRSAVHNLPARYRREMTEFNNDTKLNFTAPIKYRGDSLQMKIKAGVSFVLKDREFTEARLDYNNLQVAGLPNPYVGDANDFLSDPNLGIIAPPKELGVILTDLSTKKNSYDGFQTVSAAYGMIELPLFPSVALITGARVESTFLEMKSKDVNLATSTQQYTDVLPAANFIFTLVGDKEKRDRIDTNKVNKRNMKIRASYARTLARPTFREIAPFATENYDNGFVEIGNDSLQRTLVDNLDLRWEYFARSGELISVTGFYKLFQDPIEKVINPDAGNVELTWRNNENAQVYGVEFEFRKKLDFIRVLRNYRIGMNLTFSKSIVKMDEDFYEDKKTNDPYIDRNRAMAGQSPYIINAVFEYNHAATGWSWNAAYNVSGGRLSILVGGSTPNIYEQPAPSLDFNLQKKVSDRLTISLRAKNLLNPTVKYVYKFQGDAAAYDKFNPDDAVYLSYSKGREYKLGVSYIF